MTHNVYNMIRSVGIFLFSIFASSCFAQKHDHIWMMGYDGGERTAGIDTFGISILSFQPEQDTILLENNQEISMNFNTASVAMSDTAGNLQFYSNGLEIWNASHELMENGGGLNDDRGHLGYNLTQGILCLPYPEQDSLYAFIHGSVVVDLDSDFLVAMDSVYFSTIDMSANNGLGKVVTKMEVLVQDTLRKGLLTATRHRNGRDWWILIPEGCALKKCSTNHFYTYLLSPDGIEFIEKQGIGSPSETGIGHAVFSPDGAIYANVHSVDKNKPNILDVYDFDRCTGTLFDHRQIIESIPPDLGNGGAGLAISPNSRYAYHILYPRVMQYDLWADDIKSSEIKVAEYDGYRGPLATRFLSGQLGPDGKIYISTSNGSRFLHVIHEPNLTGLACNVEQRGLLLPTNNGFSIPNHPNYRLYDLPNSPCDTLGIDKTDISTSIESISEAEQAIKIYPNPAFDVLHIALDVPQKASIRLYNVQGQLVLSRSAEQQEQGLDISHLPAGIYFCLVQIDGKAFYSEKIVVTR